MKVVISICRTIVGALFIVSGLIKVNDVVGFSYKLEEYFSVKALGFPELLPYTVPIAMFIVIGEVLVGVAALLGAWPKLTSSLLLFMTLFFAWLTYYTATCDPLQQMTFTAVDGTTFVDTPECVTSCGCFGDAIKLTPWESFYKDIFLLPFVLPFFIFAWMGKVKLNDWKDDAVIVTVATLIVLGFSYKMLDWYFPVIFIVTACAVGIGIKQATRGKQWLMAIGVLLVCSLTQYWTYAHLPLKDYRAYAIGSDLRENMKTAEELGLESPAYLTYYTLKHSTTGEIKNMDSEAYLTQQIWKDSLWKIQPEFTYSKKIKDGYEPKIMDLSAMDMDGIDMLDSILDAPSIFLLVMWNLEEAKTSDLAELTAFALKAEAEGKQFYGFTTAGYDECENYRHEHQLAFPFLQGDEKVLKTMIRSNPGLIYMEKGKVINMWAGGDVPTYEEAKAKAFQP